MEKVNTRNPFGSSLVVLAESDEGSEDTKKKQKNVDLVKVHLACIPSLETAKKDLTEVFENVKDDGLKTTISSFIDQIEKIEEQVLTLTMQGIKNDRKVRMEDTSQSEITPDMFLDKKPAPEATAVTPKA